MKTTTASKTLNQRNPNLDNVELTLNIIEIDQLETGLLEIVIQAGFKAVGGKYLGKQFANATKAVTEDITATALLDWFKETDGTRGSTLQNLTKAQQVEKLANASMVRLSLDLAANKIDMAEFTTKIAGLSIKLEEAKKGLAEAEKAHEEYRAKVAAAAKLRAEKKAVETAK